MPDVEGHQCLLPEMMFLGSVGMPNECDYFIYIKVIVILSHL